MFTPYEGSYRSGRCIRPCTNRDCSHNRIRITARLGIRLRELWDDVLRVCIRFEVADELERLLWFGLGPDETYTDRHAAACVARWSSTVASQYHPFVVPQE